MIYGANYLIAKSIMPLKINYSAFTLLRITGAAILFYISAQIFVKEKIVWTRKLVFRLIICTLSGVFVNMLFFLKGLSLTTPFNASVMMLTTPLFVFGISYFMGREVLNKIRILGLIVGLCGAFGLIYYSSKVGMSGLAIGDLFIVINAISFAYFLVWVKPLMKEHHPIKIISYTFIFALPLIWAFSYSDLQTVDWNAFNTTDFWALAYVIVMTTFVAYLLNTWALRYAPASLAGTYIYLQPVFATALSVGFGYESLEFSKVFFSLMIFGGVYLVGRTA